MYYVDMYTYKDKPWSQYKNWGVYQLNDAGEEKFLGSDSHNANYYSRISPKVFKVITGMDYESIMKEQNAMLEARKRNQSCPEKKKICFQDSAVMNEPQKISKEEIKKEEEKNPEQLHPVLTPPENVEHFSKTAGFQGYTYSPEELENFYRTNQKNFYTPRHFGRYHRKRNFRETFGYDRSNSLGTKEMQCSQDITDLKKTKLVNDEFNSTHSSEFQFKRKYNGFTSYEVPRTAKNNELKDKPSPFNFYNKNLIKSFSCSNLRNHGIDELDTLRKDNLEMKNTLLNQTNRKFLERYKLPNIAKVAKTQKKIRKLKTPNSKMLGEKYDPYSLMVPPTNRTATNWVGALFHH